MKTPDILKTGIIQQHNTADIADNRRRIMDKIRTLAADGARLIVNQELHDSLYFCQTENVDGCDLALPLDHDAILAYGSLAAELGVVIVTSVFERRAPGLYHNTAVVFDADGT
ncbi:MAG: acyltransferase, partial [Muribaculaceae bacterium]|nr:acyltransferase [Muribaculaceae bacterium]